jgi:hypothetical protein
VRLTVPRHQGQEPLGARRRASLSEGGSDLLEGINYPLAPLIISSPLSTLGRFIPLRRSIGLQPCTAYLGQRNTVRFLAQAKCPASSGEYLRSILEELMAARLSMPGTRVIAVRSATSAHFMTGLRHPRLGEFVSRNRLVKNVHSIMASESRDRDIDHFQEL